MKYFAGIILMLLLLGMAATAGAHDAVITKSTPANGELLVESPSEVMAWFAEELVSGESTMTVFSAEGKQVDNGDGGVNLNDPDHASMIVTLPPLSDGSYTVQWRATLLDGDSSEGAFAFAVGEDQQVVPAALSAPAVEQDSDGPSIGILVAAVAGLFIVVLIGVLTVRRRKS